MVPGVAVAPLRGGGEIFAELFDWFDPQVWWHWAFAVPLVVIGGFLVVAIRELARMLVDWASVPVFRRLERRFGFVSRREQRPVLWAVGALGFIAALFLVCFGRVLRDDPNASDRQAGHWMVIIGLAMVPLAVVVLMHFWRTTSRVADDDALESGRALSRVRGE